MVNQKLITSFCWIGCCTIRICSYVKGRSFDALGSFWGEDVGVTFFVNIWCYPKKLTWTYSVVLVMSVPTSWSAISICYSHLKINHMIAVHVTWCLIACMCIHFIHTSIHQQQTLVLNIKCNVRQSYTVHTFNRRRGNLPISYIHPYMQDKWTGEGDRRNLYVQNSKEDKRETKLYMLISTCWCIYNRAKTSHTFVRALPQWVTQSFTTIWARACSILGTRCDKFMTGWYDQWATIPLAANYRNNQIATTSGDQCSGGTIKLVQMSLLCCMRKSWTHKLILSAASPVARRFLMLQEGKYSKAVCSISIE